MEILRIARRNILRNPRRTVLNVAALSLGMAVAAVGLGWVAGYHVYVYSSLIDFQTGHVHVLADGYLEEARRLPLDIAVSGYRSLRETLVDRAGVVAATGRIDFAVEMSHEGATIPLAAIAVDPPHEAEVTILENHIDSGEYLGQGVLIGRRTADRLGVAAGETVFLSAVDRHGVRNLLDAQVVGIFHFGYPALDDNVLYTDLATATRLLDMPDSVTRVVLRLDRRVSPTNFAESLNSELAENLAAYPWRRFVQAAVTAVEADVASFNMMLAIIFLLIILGILNSMSMSLHEREREFATLRAIGLRSQTLVAMVLAEALWLALISIAVAAALATPLLAYLQTTGIDIAGYLPHDLPVPFGTRFRSAFGPGHAIATAAVGIITTAVGSLIPAIRASRRTIAADLA